MGQECLTVDYNSRLFSAGLYGSHHRARFRWLRRKLTAFGLARASVLELGCFDGKTVDWLPFEVERYVGLDAGWESGERNGAAVGLAAAQRRFAGDARYTFRQSLDPEDVWRLAGEFDVGICMETLEHVEPAAVESYLAALAAKVRGPLLVTVPNEKGAALLVKTLAAKMLKVDRDIVYTAREFASAVLGRTDRVPRWHHKGFDYSALARRITHHFGTASIDGVDSRFLPHWLQPTVGIVAGRGTLRTDAPSEHRRSDVRGHSSSDDSRRAEELAAS